MKMKKLMMSLLLFGVLPFASMAQDDDMYFVPSKESKAKDAYQYGLPSKTYYSGSSRSVDDYNRRMISAVPTDSTGNDIIDFSAVRGVYPDSVASTGQSEDYQLTRRMSRFDDYTPSQAYWDGYRDGRWSSPWYYNSWYGWYDYDYWYWHSPYFYSGYGWTSPYYYGWYSPWHYGYYGPWNYGYYGSYGPRWYASTGRYTPHQGRRISDRQVRTTGGRTVTTRTTYSDNSNRSFGGSRSVSSSSGSFGGSRSGGGSFSGGGGGGGGRSTSGGRSFGGRR